MNSIVVSKSRKIIPIIAAVLGSLFLATVYFGIVSWAESFNHAVEFFWQDRWIVLPIILGFGVQVALYTIIRFKIFLPIEHVGLSGPSVGASGTTSTIAMVACCAHHLTDVLPILGLTAAATFLAKYRILFMAVGLGSSLLGIAYMLFILIREKRNFIKTYSHTLISKEI
ncbi:MAG: hypothetical protein ACYDH2_05345 [Anaerolineaceae bacterium]